MRSMSASVLCLLLLVSLGTAAAGAQSTHMLRYKLQDASLNGQYAEGSNEYHCFDVTDEQRTYVRGTYGFYGYFEGAVDSADPLVFHVNWWETGKGTLLPTSGAGTIKYSATFETISGPYWESGSSDMLGSYGVWSAANGTVVARDNSPSGKQAILQKCLYPGAATARPRTSIAALTQTSAVSGSADTGEVTLCSMPAGPANGSWLGTYTYVYGDDDGGGTERGNYGTNSFAIWGASGMGYVGTWHASTGGYAGTQGSLLHLTVADDTKTYMVGFFCNVNAKLVQTECFTEYYEVTSTNYNADNCPAYYQKDHTLDPLYKFASLGSTLAPAEDDGNSINNQSPGLMFLLGLLTAVLLAIVYQFFTHVADHGRPVAQPGSAVPDSSSHPLVSEL
jgi:hypothetical protein